jgi:hypothetical protein
VSFIPENKSIRHFQTMDPIAAWNAAQFDASLYEEENPPENDVIGGLKTRNTLDGRPQRRFLQISSEESPFRKTVELVVCIHGMKRNGEDVTLIIYRVHLSCPRESRYRSARLRFAFTTCDPGQNTTPTEVLAWAPFNTQERFATGDLNVTSKTTLGGSLGAEAIGKAELNLGKEWERNFTQNLYGSAESDAHYNEDIGVMTGVQWYFTEAKRQEDGVLPDFHVAIIVKPPRDTGTGRALQFNGAMKLRVEAGIYGRVSGFFREGRQQNEPVLFDPALPAHFCGSGDRLRNVLQPGMDLGGCMEDALLGIIGLINQR